MAAVASYSGEGNVAGYAYAGIPALRALPSERDGSPALLGGSVAGQRVSRSSARAASRDQGTGGDTEAVSPAAVQGAVRGKGPTGSDEAKSLFSAQQEQSRAGEKVGEDGLTDSERREVDRLKARDREVRDHEQAHVAAGGPYVSAPSFRFVRGPDGQFYAVGGEVQIDASPVPGNPQATIRKMEVVKRAALAPQKPSAQDRRVAAQAEAQMMRARRQITDMEREEAAAAAERRATQLAEETGHRRNLPVPGSEPTFDPEARFRHATGGIGPMPGSGLAGAGNLETSVTGTLDAGALFNLVA